LSSVWNASASECFAPQLTTICDGAYSRPLSRFSLAAISSHSRGMPLIAVYFVWPRRSASVHAS
jgi:hypothetical protein